MIRWLGLVLACASPAACHQITASTFPEPNADTKSIVIIAQQGACEGELESQECIRHVYAADGVLPPSLTAADGSKLILVHYDRPLDALRLRSGKQDIYRGVGLARRLPSSTTAYEAMVVESGVSDWDDLVLFPDVSLQASGADCVTLTTNMDMDTVPGCFDSEEDLRERICSICPDPGRIETPALPELPELPIQAPCGTWSEVETLFGSEEPTEICDGSIPDTVSMEFRATLCSPPDRVLCAANQVQFLEDTVCTACTSEWPVDVPPTNVAYVDPNATGGVGTQADPYGSITQALANQTPGLAIALKKGIHRADLVLTGDVDLIGACAAETTIEPLTITSTVMIVRGTTKVRGIRFRTGSTTGIHVHSGGVLQLSDVVVHGSTADPPALHVGGTLNADDLVVVGGSGDGLLLDGGGASLRKVVFDGVGGTSIRAEASADFDLIEGLIIRAGRRAISISDAIAEIDRIVIRDVGSSCETSDGGIFIDSGSSVRLLRSRLEDIRCQALLVGSDLEDGSTATVADTVIRGVVHVLEGGPGAAVALFGDSHLKLERVVIADIGHPSGKDRRDEKYAGIDAMASQTNPNFRPNVELRHLLVQNIEGRGIEVDGERFDFSRIFVDWASFGVAIGQWTEFEGADVTLGRIACENAACAAFEVRELAHGSLERLSVYDTCERAVRLRDSGDLALSELTVSRVPRLAVELAETLLAKFDLQNVLIEQAAAGIVVGTGNTMISGLVIRDSRPTSTFEGFGVQLPVSGGLSLADFDISGCADAALIVSSDTFGRISNGRVAGNAIGARVPQTLDTDRLLVRVKFEGNQENFQRLTD